MCAMNVHSFLESKPAVKLQMKPAVLAMAIIGATASSHTMAYMEVNSDTYASISRAGEVDTYTFRITSPQEIEIYTTGNIDTYGTLKNARGNRVASNDDGGNDLNFKIRETLSTGVYRISVRHYSSSGTGSYRIYLRGSNTPPTSDDHSNSRSSATRVSLNTIKTGTIETGGDIDYFRINVDRTQTVNLTTTGNTDTYGTLYDSNGNRVASNDDGGEGYNFNINRRLSRGTYYLAVKGYSSSTTGVYRLRVRGNGGSNSGSNDDHGNSRRSATRISLDSSSNGQIERGGDIDYFRINVGRTQTVNLTTTGNTDTYGTLYHSNGNRVASNDDGGEGYNFNINERLSRGTYYLAVKGYSSSTTGSYRLRVRGNNATVSAPTLRYPRNGASGLNNATFRWNAVTGADRYRIVISQDRNFSGFNETNNSCSNCYTTIKSGTSHTSNSFNLSNHRYYWKVGSVVNGRVVAWSEARSFVSGNASRIVHPLPNGRTLSSGRCQLGTPCVGSGVHRGVDLMASANSNVYSMCSGTVRLNATNRSTWNSFLIVRHDCNGTEYYGYYGHISSRLSVDSSVSAGQVLGSLKYYPGNGYDNTHLHMGLARSYHSSGWGYGSSLSDFIDFRSLLD